MAKRGQKGHKTGLFRPKNSCFQILDFARSLMSAYSGFGCPKSHFLNASHRPIQPLMELHRFSLKTRVFRRITPGPRPSKPGFGARKLPPPGPRQTTAPAHQKPSLGALKLPLSVVSRPPGGVSGGLAPLTRACHPYVWAVRVPGLPGPGPSKKGPFWAPKGPKIGPERALKGPFRAQNQAGSFSLFGLRPKRL